MHNYALYKKSSNALNARNLVLLNAFCVVVSRIAQTV
jgi:hypothetical protein